MNKITQSLTLDLVEVRHNIINARQGDQLIRDLTITITNNGNTFPIPEDADVRLRGARPDGKYVFYDCTDSLDEQCAITDRTNGIVHVPIPDFLLSSSGRAYLDIGIYQDIDGQKTEVASTEKFVLYIPEKIFSEEDVVNSHEGSTLSELIRTTKELDKKVSENESERQKGYAVMGNQINNIQSTVNENKTVWDDKYTKNEVDNKFSSFETNIDWKESVSTYDDIVTTYPEPQDGWTVNVKDTDYTYRWNGTEWVAISANAIPKATSSVDGLLAKEDKISYDDANAKKHQHSNKEVLDGITAGHITKWNSFGNDMTGSTSESAGTHGLVPAPPVTSASLFLKSDGSWGVPDSSPQIRVDSIILDSILLNQSFLASYNPYQTITKTVILKPDLDYTLYFNGIKLTGIPENLQSWGYTLVVNLKDSSSGTNEKVKEITNETEKNLTTTAYRVSKNYTFNTTDVLEPSLEIKITWSGTKKEEKSIESSSYQKNNVTVSGLGNSFSWAGRTLGFGEGFSLDVTGLTWDHLTMAYDSSSEQALDGVLYPILLHNDGNTSSYKNGFKTTKNGNIITIYYNAYPADAVGNTFKFYFDNSYNTVVVHVSIPNFNYRVTPYNLSLKYETASNFSGSYNDLTNKPTSLPASGGNADTVDSKHASAFLGNGTGYVCPSVNGGNANDYKNEFHGFVFNMSNVPDQGSTNGEYGYGFLDVSKFDGTGFQPATSGVIRQRFTTWKTAKEYVRTYQNGTWSSWRFVADNGGADSVFDYSDRRLIRMNYSATEIKAGESGWNKWFAAWVSTESKTELRAIHPDLVASEINALQKSGGKMTGTLTAMSGKNSDSYSNSALDMSNSNITNVNGIYTADNAENGSEGINFYRSATTVDSVHASGGKLYFTPNRTLGTNGTSYAVPGIQYGGALQATGFPPPKSESYSCKDYMGHGRVHFVLPDGMGGSVTSGTWTTIGRVSYYPSTTIRGHVIIADGAYSLSGTERAGCTINSLGEVAIISPVSFSGKYICVDAFW